MVVMPDADLDLAVEGALFGGFGTAGQRCTSLGTLWAHADVYDELLAPLRRGGVRRRRRRPDAGRAVRADDLAQRYLDRHEKNLSLSRPPHRPRLDRHRPDHVGQPADRVPRRPRRAAFSPTRRSSRASAPATRCTTPRRSARSSGSAASTDLDEAIELANGHGYGLSASIYTHAPESVWRFRAGTGAGMVSVNNSTSGAEAHLPFGGNGRSGNGSRQSGSGCSTSSPGGSR